MPLHDVDVTNGCMHFIDGGHQRRRARTRRRTRRAERPAHCEPDEARAVACPLRVGGVTFHHSKTPHMTTANDIGRVAAHPDATPARRRLRGRRRPLSVEGLRQPVHGRTHHATHPLNRDTSTMGRRVVCFLPGDYRPVPNELAQPNVDAFVAALTGALRAPRPRARSCSTTSSRRRPTRSTRSRASTTR